MTHPNRARMSRLTLGLLAVLATAPAFAQSTSAGVGGRVTGNDGTPVSGAQVTITHTESGTVSTATTDADGRYSARGLRVGGPYTVTVTKDGQSSTEENIYLQLNNANAVNASLVDVTTLEAVKAVGVGGSEVFSATKMGTGTNVSRQTIEALPSINGNIQDYIRLDPRVAQTSKADGSISAGGQNPRYNAIRIDGVSASDTFGLEANNMPTRRQPVAMDAIEALNIDLASYDVTITGATGAVIDAVTKSGTNEFHGSVYGTYRNDSMVGDDPPTAANPDGAEFNGFEDEKTYGATLGGPLLKDKLFFFANYEKFEQGAPGADLSSSPIGAGTISQTDIERIQTIAAGYGIDAGSLESNSDTELEEYAVKLDWNINDAHRASLRYSNLDQSKLRLNGFFTGATGGVGLSSYWYQHDKEIESWVGQVFSDWTDNFSTEFKASYRDYSAIRTTPGTAPSIDIGLGAPDRDGTAGNPDVFLGTEVNSQQNVLTTETWNFFGAGTLTFADHDLKFGFDYSDNDIYNLYGPQLYGVYEFNSIDDFEAGHWSQYDFRTPQPGQGYDGLAATYGYENIGLFLQDQWFVNSNLTLSFGLRADRASVDSRPQYNALAETVYGYDNSDVMDSTWLVQPRIGFNYTFNSARPTQLRGGFGLFQGDAPQVWLSNAYNTTGFNYIQYSQFGNPQNWIDLPFGSTPDTQPIPADPTAARMNVNFIADDFEQPAVWKANLAFDTELPWYGIVFSAEALFTKVKSALFYRKLDLGAPTGVADADGRELYWSNPNNGSGATGANRDPRFQDVFLLDTTSKGASQQLTVGLEKPWSSTSDWSWSLGYTYTNATAVGDLTSSTASSGWRYTYIHQANEEVEATSRYEIQDRFTGILNWKHAFFGDNNTQVGLFYEGRSGRPFSYVYGNDVNGDGRVNDLFYVPAGPGDVTFSGGAAMEQAFFDWLANNPELERYRGQVVERNSGQADWVNTFDLRISQELPGFAKGHKSEVWVDFVNVGNLINKDWGQVYDYGFFADMSVLRTNGIDPVTGKYIYNFTTPEAATPANGDQDGFNTGVSQWSIQVGFRYKF
jgi:hypothetical protein